MAAPGQAVPGTAVPGGSLAAPGGAQGIAGAAGAAGGAGAPGAPGSAAFTLSSANFTVPPVGQTVNVTLTDASWVTVGQMVAVAGAGGSATAAGSLQCTNKAGNVVTLLNSPGTAVPSSSEDVGSIKAWPSVTPPASWLLADGSAVSRTLYPALFNVIGTTWGTGDGSTTFNVPDLRGRFVLGMGQGASLTNRVLAALGGEENHQLTVAELAQHSHNYNNVNVAGASIGQGSPSLGLLSQATTSAGSNTPHNNLPPFLVVTYIIKVSLTGGSTAQAPIADASQNGLLRQVSGNTTDYIGGDNASHPLANVLGPALVTGNPDAAWTYGPYDDHFDGASLNAKWTFVPQSGLIGSSTSVGGSRLCMSASAPADATSRLCQLTQPVTLTAPVSVRCKLRWAATFAVNVAAVLNIYIALAGAASSYRVRVGFVNNAAYAPSANINQLITDGGTNFGTNLSSVGLVGGIPDYWRMDYNAGGACAFYFSYDGTNWISFTNATGAQTGFASSPVTQFQFGLITQQSSINVLWCDWLRFQ